MARRSYSLQFKQEAVAMVKAEDATVSSVARGLGIRAQTLHYWIEHPPRARRGQKAIDDPACNDPAALKLRLKEAESRIRRLEMEKEILKKATAFFASQSP